MTLLDNLEKEAQAARERRAGEQAAGQARTAAQTARLQPALQRTHRFFSDLRSHMNDIDRKVRTDVRIPGIGELHGLLQQNYRVWTEDEGELPPVGFRFDCIGSQPLDARLDSEAALAGHERTLRDAGLSVRRRHDGPRRFRLEVAAEVPVSLTFSADVERGMLRMAARNLFNIGTQVYFFAPERIDAPFLEALAKTVLREPSRFAELSGNAVDDGNRAALRKQLAREKRRRDAELRGPLLRAVFPLTECVRRVFLGQ